MALGDFDLGELFPFLFEDGDEFFPIEVCDCGWGRSFCNCDAPWPIGKG